MKPNPPEPKKSTRKPYTKPQVKEFGRVAELTRAVSTSGLNDGGMSLMTKT
jgi:hypothetical protein